jgi:hypothetical protein
VRKGIELSEKPLNKLSEKEVRSAGLRHDFNVYAVQKNIYKKRFMDSKIGSDCYLIIDYVLTSAFEPNSVSDTQMLKCAI